MTLSPQSPQPSMPSSPTGEWIALADLAGKMVEQAQSHAGNPRVNPQVLRVRSAAGAASALLVHRLREQHKGPVVVVTADGEQALSFCANLSFLTGQPFDAPPLHTSAGDGSKGAGSFRSLPDAHHVPHAEVNPDLRSQRHELTTLTHLALGGELEVLVVPIRRLAQRTLPKATVAASAFRLAEEDERDPHALTSLLQEMGYLSVPVVEDPGCFARRGGLLDLWPIGAQRPVRIEFYGDMVLALRVFDPDTQKTQSDCKQVVVPPARRRLLHREHQTRCRKEVHRLCDEVDFPSSKRRKLLEDLELGRQFFGAGAFLPAYQELASLQEYLPEDALWIFEQPAEQAACFGKYWQEAERQAGRQAELPHFPLPELLLDEAQLAGLWQHAACTSLVKLAMEGRPEGPLEALSVGNGQVYSLQARSHQQLERAIANARTKGAGGSGLEPLFERLAHFRDNGLRTLIACKTAVQRSRLQGLLRGADEACELWHEPIAAWLGGSDSQPGSVHLAVGRLAQGCELSGDGVVLLAEGEIFGQGKTAKRSVRKRAKKTQAFLEDLRSLHVGDFLVHREHGIGRYAGLIHRSLGAINVDLLCVEYAGGDKLYVPVYRLNQIQKFSGKEAAPKLDKLGGTSFAKTKAKVKRHVQKMADELLRLYAQRQAARARALPPLDDEYRAFEATFPFEETPDQGAAIADVLDDLQKTEPMDRLVCGDVGFGKTEVAIRAAFCMANSGRQVALLCPTTVLAQQHFVNLSARLQNYPFEVVVLSRFQTKKQQSEALAKLKQGSADIVVGTHRLLSKDVHFKDLGLLVVDEEQRFGVKHKERLKHLRKNVHALTLSATPIPRTLQMAIGGLRSLSLITTPPVDRRAIRTIVSKVDPVVAAEATERELARGGQVFYVYNRVEGLYERANRLQRLLPHAKLAVAHGQLSEAELERVMVDFVAGEYDVLCATAIIESGLDIPRANTMIIDRADRFGLAQLYQLRGRVGRSKERACCHLMVPAASAMNEDARSRIEALERHSDLGAGFQIASLDLELRGGGDLLGSEQSGAVGAVGFELFCHMLEQAVAELRGEPFEDEIDTELTIDSEALLPDTYVEDIGIRLSLYKRLSQASDENTISDLALEMEDRFGPPPPAAGNLVELMRLKTELRRLKVVGCEASRRQVVLHLRQDCPLDPVKLAKLVEKRAYALTPDLRLTRRFGPDADGDGLVHLDLVLADLAPLSRLGSGASRKPPGKSRLSGRRMVAS